MKRKKGEKGTKTGTKTGTGETAAVRKTDAAFLNECIRRAYVLKRETPRPVRQAILRDNAYVDDRIGMGKDINDCKNQLKF